MRLRKMSDEIAFMKGMADGHDPKIMATYWDISDVRMCDGSQSLTDADCEMILEKFCDMNCMDQIFESVNESLQYIVDEFEQKRLERNLVKRKQQKRKVQNNELRRILS